MCQAIILFTYKLYKYVHYGIQARVRVQKDSMIRTFKSTYNFIDRLLERTLNRLLENVYLRVSVH